MSASESTPGLPLTDYVPKPSPLPPLSTTDPLTKNQWDTMLAFADTIVPCIRPTKSAHKGKDLGLAEAEYALVVNKIERGASLMGKPDLVAEYLGERPSENQQFKDNMYRLLSQFVPADLKQQLTLGLTLLE